MTRFKGILKIFLVIVLFVFVLSIVINTVNINLTALDNSTSTASGAKDPHSHVGEKTLCYNQETWDCDS
jgi:hypothetical protein